MELETLLNETRVVENDVTRLEEGSARARTKFKTA
jgi:hypothetical protein